ncbi:MAG: SDR family oxidoreductase [Firmicutes bacterium]|nr:SDR family oxidoreductase [Bacillota bacterium]MCL5063800.1 SDR family oxidoreductase [Bacillota bacterium]
MKLEMQGKFYLVMGASRGLGQAVAQALSEEGAMVFLTSRNAEIAAKAAQPLGGVGLSLDTSDSNSIAKFLSEWHRHPLDGIFVNTGGPRPGDLEDLDMEAFTLAYQQLLGGPVQLMKSLKPCLRAGASVLFNTSVSIRRPIPSLLLSNVFRPAVAALAKSLALTWAEDHIRVNAIAPGRIATERIQELDRAQAERTHTPISDIHQAQLAAIPLRRTGNPEEFAKLAAFLLSPAASYITGETIVIGGGV